MISIPNRPQFAPGRLKGVTRNYRDPRPEREGAVPGKVVVVGVVTPEGHVTEPRILQSTDKRVASYMLELITRERFVPARVRSAAVFSLWADEFVFGSDSRRPRDSPL